MYNLIVWLRTTQFCHHGQHASLETDSMPFSSNISTVTAMLLNSSDDDERWHPHHLCKPNTLQNCRNGEVESNYRCREIVRRISGFVLLSLVPVTRQRVISNIVLFEEYRLYRQGHLYRMVIWILSVDPGRSWRRTMGWITDGLNNVDMQNGRNKMREITRFICTFILYPRIYDPLNIMQ